MTHCRTEQFKVYFLLMLVCLLTISVIHVPCKLTRDLRFALVLSSSTQGRYMYSGKLNCRYYNVWTLRKNIRLTFIYLKPFMALALITQDIDSFFYGFAVIVIFRSTDKLQFTCFIHF